MNHTATRLTAVLMALVMEVSITACGNADSERPPEISYGRDICIECGMIIDDPRFAAIYDLADGTEKKFDDLGGLVLHGREHRELETARVWVSDFEQERLIDAKTAYYVPTLGVVSPMGHGILAFEEASRAERLAADLDGEVITWDLVKKLPVIEGRVGDHHSD